MEAVFEVGDEELSQLILIGVLQIDLAVGGDEAANMNAVGGHDIGDACFF